MISERQHQLRLHLSESPLGVHGDHARLTQVAANLLSNAAKYTEPGGTITVITDREGDDALLRVRDTGLGIPSKDLGTVFEFFSQIPEHQSRLGGGGLGLGLALSRQLVHMHGGTIEATSEGLGRGSEFVVRLPLRMLLELKGHVVEAVYGGPAALERVRKFKPEIVFLDLGLPGMDGFEVARQIRAMPAGDSLAIIAITGWGQAEDKLRTKEAGFDRHLTKPVDVDTLDSIFTLRK